MTSAKINDRASPVSSRSDKTDKESESNEDDEEEEGKNSLDDLAHEDEMRVRLKSSFFLSLIPLVF